MGNGGSSNKMKLHLDCGSKDKHADGYINIDKRKLPHVDLVADVSQRLPYEDETVDEILAESILEHIPHNIVGMPSSFKMSKTIAVLKDWHRVLKQEGRLVLRVPNIEGIIRAYLAKKIPIVDFIGYVWGNGEYEGNRHLVGFDVEIMSACLRCAGFKDVKFVDAHKYTDALSRELSWEMGVIATKGGSK
jgi:predicted SAM-dependent methyltransferase